MLVNKLKEEQVPYESSRIFREQKYAFFTRFL